LILKVTWNAITDAATWVVLNDDNGEVMGAVQVEGKPLEERNSPRKYEIFGPQMGVPPDGGTVEAGIVDDARVLALWTKHQGPQRVAAKEEPDGARAPG
jgi:hypothetical protein